MPTAEAWVGLGGYFWDQEDAPMIPGALIQEETVVSVAKTRFHAGVRTLLHLDRAALCNVRSAEIIPAYQRPPFCATALWRHLAGHEKRE